MKQSDLKLVKMSEVELQEVNWLWKPYIPFGKITIIQGDPGEGKTTFALRLAAACSNGTALPGMESCEPFPVIYQTAEDGLADTIKPRLMDAGANQDMVLNIVEDQRSLTLLDKRIEEAIVHDKSSLAPEGKSIAFRLGDESGFAWLEGYEDISSDEILCGYRAETKTAEAENLIRDMLSGGDPVACNMIFDAAEARGISRRTVNAAKAKISDLHTFRAGSGWMWQLRE